MNENMLRAIVTVLVNDQAYLYASVQGLEHKVEKGYDMDEDVFLKMQDDFKEEFASMVAELASNYEMDEIVYGFNQDETLFEEDGGEEEE